MLSPRHCKPAAVWQDAGQEQSFVGFVQFACFADLHGRYKHHEFPSLTKPDDDTTFRRWRPTLDCTLQPILGERPAVPC